MRPHKYTSEGIVLARRNYGEADRILSLYTKDYGRVTLLAKGIRRPKSKKRGHLEIFSLVRFGANTGHGIDLITEAEVKDDYKDIRSNLSRISLAYYFMEVIGKTTHEQEKNEDLFDLILSSLDTLRTTNKLKEQRNEFILKLLTLLGFWPEGKIMNNPDEILEDVVERKISSVRVGKRMLE
jgi:DNA repair protein RecO (recombination protein O)